MTNSNASPIRYFKGRLRVLLAPQLTQACLYLLSPSKQTTPNAVPHPYAEVWVLQLWLEDQALQTTPSFVSGE